MYEFRLQFSGSVPADHAAAPDHAATLERIGREIVELLRLHSYRVDSAQIGGLATADLTRGIEPGTIVSGFDDDRTKNERIPRLPESDGTPTSLPVDGADATLIVDAPNVVVHVDRVEIPSPDPDRFATEMAPSADSKVKEKKGR